MKYTVNNNYDFVQRVMLTVPAISHTVKNKKPFKYTVNSNYVIVQADDIDRPSNQPHCKKLKPFQYTVNDNCVVAHPVLAISHTVRNKNNFSTQ
jgi:hypothetical protein